MVKDLAFDSNIARDLFEPYIVKVHYDIPLEGSEYIVKGLSTLVSASLKKRPSYKSRLK